MVPPVRSKSASRIRLPVSRCSGKRRLRGDRGRSRAGLGAGEGDHVSRFRLGWRLRRAQTAQPRDGFALGAEIEGGVQKLDRAGAQRLQNRGRIVMRMQADHLHRRRQGGDETDQVRGRRQVRGQIEQHHLRLQLPRADLQRLLRRITLQVRQNLKRAASGEAWPGTAAPARGWARSAAR